MILFSFKNNGTSFQLNITNLLLRFLLLMFLITVYFYHCHNNAVKVIRYYWYMKPYHTCVA